jgi:hypothetical protein
MGEDSQITSPLLSPIGGKRHPVRCPDLNEKSRRGKIYLVLGTPLANKQADEVFQQYQEQAEKGELLLRRYPLRSVSTFY